jgi:4-hydroxybenzoate polyprenyltransferase
MSREFFVGEWLRRRPVTYLWTHMLIMPLIDLYATACDWLPTRGAPPPGIFWFVVVSFWNGMVVELGRKIRAPEHEEPGVETYSALWGPATAAGAWTGVTAVTAAAAIAAARLIDFVIPVAILLGGCLLAAGALSRAYARRPVHRLARWLEPLSGLWTLVLYLLLGVVPLLLGQLGVR